MSNIYRGMCIGGPLDGKHAKFERDVLKVCLPLPTTFVPIMDEPMPTDATVDTFVYRHVAFHFRNTNRPGWEETRGFWTPEGVEDQHLYVLDELAKAYRERANG